MSFQKNTFLDQQLVKIIRKDYFSLTSGKAIYNKVKLNFYFVYANQYIKNSCAAAVSGNKDFLMLQNNFKQNICV